MDVINNCSSVASDWGLTPSVVVSLVAITVTSGFAIYGILDARAIRRRTRDQALRAAVISIDQTVIMFEELFYLASSDKPGDPINWLAMGMMLESAVPAARQTLSRDIPDVDLFSIAIDLQILVDAFLQMHAKREHSEVKTVKQWLAAIKPFRDDFEGRVEDFERACARLKIRRPSTGHQRRD